MNKQKQSYSPGPDLLEKNHQVVDWHLKAKQTRVALMSP